MKKQLLAKAGFTLVELAVSLGVVAMCGGVLFSAIRTVAMLGAKNTMVNVSHQQSRETIHKAVFQIHSSVAIPSMASTSLAAVAGNGPAPGVTYQTLVCGPNRVWSSAATGTNVIRITVKAGAPVPQAGMRLLVPAFRVEEDITAATSAGSSTYNLTLANSLSTSITCSSGTPNYLVYVTQRSGLVVVNGELRHYPRTTSGTYSVVATNIDSDTPFSVPGGDNRFVQADFVMRDPKVAGLNLKSMDMQLSLTVPYRARLATRQ